MTIQGPKQKRNAGRSSEQLVGSISRPDPRERRKWSLTNNGISGSLRHSGGHLELKCF